MVTKATDCCIRADLVNIFDMFIPQLLRYPNPSDPLNGEAASLLMKDADLYNKKVKGMGVCRCESLQSLPAGLK